MRFSDGISTPSNRGINLPLALLVARILADHAYDILAFHDLASFTESFY